MVALRLAQAAPGTVRPATGRPARLRDVKRAPPPPRVQRVHPGCGGPFGGERVLSFLNQNSHFDSMIRLPRLPEDSLLNNRVQWRSDHQSTVRAEIQFHLNSDFGRKLSEKVSPLQRTGRLDPPA